MAPKLILNSVRAAFAVAVIVVAAGLLFPDSIISLTGFQKKLPAKVR